MKFGVDVRLYQSNVYDNSNLLGGSYNFAAARTADGLGGPGSSLATFAFGILDGYTVKTTQQPFYYRWHYYAGYAQDDFKIRPNLTLNIGMRYEIETPRSEKYDHQAFFDPSVNGTLNGKPVTGGFIFPGQNGRGSTLWPVNYTGFEPRIGFAYTPFSNFMTIRASYAILRSPLTGLGKNVFPDLNVNAQAIGGPQGGVTPGSYLNVITNKIGSVGSNSLLGGGPYFSGTGLPLAYIEQSSLVPSIQQWSFGFQFQFSKTTVLETTYSGSKGTHLFTPPTDLNLPSYGTIKSLIAQHANFSASNIPNPYGVTDQNGAVIQESLLQSLRPFQQFFSSNIPRYFDRSGDSTYHALYVSVKQRFSRGLFLQANYSWSKSLTDVAQNSANYFDGVETFGGANPQSPLNLSAEKSLAANDIPHRLTVAYTYELPVGRGRMLNTSNRILDYIAGGWNTSGFLTAQSGYPLYVSLGGAGYWISQGGGDALLQGGNLRPNIVPNVPLYNPDWRKDPYNTPYLNPAAFTVPGSLDNPDFGNAPRTLAGIRNPGSFFYDASVQKRFRIGGERIHLDLRVDAINALNHPDFSSTRRTGTRCSTVSTAGLSPIPPYRRLRIRRLSAKFSSRTPAKEEC